MNENTNNHLNKGRRRKIVVVTVAILLVVVSFFSGYFLNLIINGKKINRVTEVLRLIENVGFILDENGEPREITEEELADALVNGVLDRYSKYYNAEEYEEKQRNGKGISKGVGIAFYDENLTVDEIVGNSPADRAGIVVGDELSYGEYNGNVTEFENYSDLIEFFNSVPNDTEFKLAVSRNSQNVEFLLKKCEYKIRYVLYYDSEFKYTFESNDNGVMEGKAYQGQGMSELPNDTAYISLSLFEGDADKQLISALDYMKERGKNKLIFDLRGNGGGYMRILTEIAGCLIHCNGKNNFTVAVAESKNAKERFYSGKNRFNTQITSIVVLADQNTASASECLIGAMIYYGGVFSQNKLVIEKGENGKTTTLGKGIMQTTYGFIGGGALKLTTARILWPDEQTCIHGKGIETISENQVDAEDVISRALEVL